MLVMISMRPFADEGASLPANSRAGLQRAWASLVASFAGERWVVVATKAAACGRETLIQSSRAVRLRRHTRFSWSSGRHGVEFSHRSIRFPRLALDLITRSSHRHAHRHLRLRGAPGDERRIIAGGEVSECTGHDEKRLRALDDGFGVHRERSGIDDDVGWERCYARFERKKANPR
jgi:hypothetical protein